MIKKVKENFKALYGTNIGRLILGVVLVIIGAIMSPNGSIGQYVHYKNETTVWDVIMYTGCVYIIGSIIIWVIYAWIINPIRNFKNKRGDN